MSVEVSDVVVAMAPADDVVVLIDPIELTPVAVIEPLPVELPEDGLTYVGPIDVHVDPFPIDPLPTDLALTDDTAGEGAPVDDGSIITTAVIDDVPTDIGVTDGGDGIGRPVDPEPNWRTLDGPADGGSASADTGDGSTGDATAMTDDVGIIACEDYPVYKSECGQGEGPNDVNYKRRLLYQTCDGDEKK